MDRIASFTINHLDLFPGLYVSRRDKKGDCVITTFDMRITAPNHEPVVDMPALHTIEHLGATYLRNCPAKGDIVYFGPMGCRTGFYFLVRNLSHQQALDLIKETVKKCSEHSGEIPGTTAIECGNYKEHDKNGAVSALKEYYSLLKDYNTDNLQYN